MNIHFAKPNLTKPDFDALAINVYEDEKIPEGFHGLTKTTVALIQRLIDSQDFKAEKNKRYRFYPLADYPFRLLLVGSGKRSEFNANVARENAGAAIKSYLGKKVSTIALDFDIKADPDHVQAITEGIVLASFEPAMYKKKEDTVDLTEVTINMASTARLTKAMQDGRTIGEAINWARHLEFQPANHVTPTVLVSEARKLAAESKLAITVYDETQARERGMGGFSAMAQGSDEPSFMVVLEYKGSKSKKGKIGLVGKGITFDSGGISIKPSRSMHEMKMDMCGAANVMAIMKIIAYLKLPVNLIAAMPITENMPSGKAIKPGDVVTALNGKTIEITNTDAEGRVVMSDALVLVQQAGATRLLEFSTLTGAVLVALGDITTAVMANDQAYLEQILATAKAGDEPMWPLPTDDRYKDLIKSQIADMVNAEGPGKIKGAGTIAGYIFLQEFIEKGNQFAHFDIAGTAWGSGSAYLSHGATGVGIRTAVAFIRTRLSS